ncbi:MAG: Nif3-like dinuclear metal center hexameric protein, partial [Clostridiales Family XIII bacterium]|nr:Nif3-like dinuclear metal center hexameric protein [Clostridiales Family XIII bacterium]
MSVKTSELKKVIKSFAPPELQESWDNSGWQIDLGAGEVNRVLVALEIVRGTVSEAVREKADVILTHHPLFFMPIKNIDVASLEGEYAAKLIAAGISVYSAHTSFDAAPGGMNDTLAELCGLTEVKPFDPGRDLDVPDAIIADGTETGSAGTGAPMARVGILANPVPFAEYADRVAKAIGMEGRLKTVGDSAARIKTVAVCGGGGGDYIPGITGGGIDVYITSDIKHHQAQWAKERGLCLIDGGHYGTEH